MHVTDYSVVFSPNDEVSRYQKYKIFLAGRKVVRILNESLKPEDISKFKGSIIAKDVVDRMLVYEHTSGELRVYYEKNLPMLSPDQFKQLATFAHEGTIDNMLDVISLVRM